MVGTEGGGRNSKISSREGEEGTGCCHATFTVEFSQKGKAYRFRIVPFALDRSVPVGSERGQGPLHGSFFSALVHLLSASSLADTLSLLQRTKSFTSLKLNSTVVVTSKIGIRNLLHHQDCSFQSISTPFLRLFFRCELTFLPPSLPPFTKLSPLPLPPPPMHALSPPSHQPPPSLHLTLHHQPPSLPTSLAEALVELNNGLGSLGRKYRHLPLPSPLVLLKSLLYGRRKLCLRFGQLGGRKRGEELVEFRGQSFSLFSLLSSPRRRLSFLSSSARADTR